MMENSENWKLIFVIPIAMTAIIIIPFFFAAWISTMILIFKGFKDLVSTFTLPDQKEDLKLFFKLKSIIQIIKEDGFNLLNVRALGISVFLHGFALILVLAGGIYFIEKVMSIN